MPPTHNPNSESKTALDRSAFEEPTISDPMELAGPGSQPPMMAMLTGSGGGGSSLDGGGFPIDGLGLDVTFDGSVGPAPDGGAND